MGSFLTAKSLFKTGLFDDIGDDDIALLLGPRGMPVTGKCKRRVADGSISCVGCIDCEFRDKTDAANGAPLLRNAVTFDVGSNFMREVEATGEERRSFPLPEGALNDIPLITAHEY